MSEELTHEQIKKVQALYPKIAPELNEINGLKEFIDTKAGLQKTILNDEAMEMRYEGDPINENVPKEQQGFSFSDYDESVDYLSLWASSKLYIGKLEDFEPLADASDRFEGRNLIKLVLQVAMPDDYPLVNDIASVFVKYKDKFVDKKLNLKYECLKYFIFYYIVKQLEKQGFVPDKKFTNIEYPNDEEPLTAVFRKQWLWNVSL